MVGTSVRDRMNDMTIANTTDNAIGTNRKPATPGRKNIGTNTMQMHSSETKAGVTIWAAPSRIERSTGLPFSRCQLMFSIVTVASSTRMPIAHARPSSVIPLTLISLQSVVVVKRGSGGVDIG